jgi:FkbM family methyltransferase
MRFRNLVHASGRMLCRVLLHPRCRTFAPSVWTYQQLYLLGKRLTEHSEVATLRSLTAPGMIIADVGANIGFYTLQMAAWVGPAGRILAFEPDPLNARLLRTRANAARAANVEVHQLALGDRRGKARLYCSAYNRADNRLGQRHQEPHVEACDVEVRTLDDVLDDRGLTGVHAMKIDVQGHEAQVLRGAQKTMIAGVRWLWLEFSPDHLRGSGSDPERFLEALTALGMDLFEVTEQGDLRPLTDYSEHIRKLGSGYGDVVLIRRPSQSMSDGETQRE